MSVRNIFDTDDSLQVTSLKMSYGPYGSNSTMEGGTESEPVLNSNLNPKQPLDLTNESITKLMRVVSRENGSITAFDDDAY